MSDEVQLDVSPVDFKSQPIKGSPSVHLDALRGVAAFSVLLFHWRSAFFVKHYQSVTHNPLVAAAYGLTDGGHQWVVVFFALSGYLVGGSVLRSVATQRWSWRGYLLARLTRLYVVLIPALLLGAILDWTGMHMAGTETIYSGRSGMHFLTGDVHSTLTLPVLAENVLFLQNTMPMGVRSHLVPCFGTNGPLWSLSCEFWYYMAFPLLILLSSRGQGWRVRMLLCLGLAASVLIVGDITILWFSIPWLAGAFVACLPALPTTGPWMRGTAVGVALMVFVAGFKFDEIHPIFADPVLGLAVALLIWVILCCATAPVPSWYAKLAQKSARSSYTLYLFHIPMLVFLKASLHLPFYVPGWYSFLVAGGMLLVILLYAQLAYELFEKHTDEVRSWLKSNAVFSRSIVMNRMAGRSSFRGTERRF